MTYVPANDNRDVWAIVGAMLAALLGAGWASRRRERAPNGSAGKFHREGESEFALVNGSWFARVQLERRKT